MDLNLEEEEGTPSTSTPRPDQGKSTPRWAIPGATSRKRKSRSDGPDRVLEAFMQQKRKMDEADSIREKQESADLSNFMKIQHEAEERRFRAMMEQQQATTQQFLQIMGTFARAVLCHSTQPASQWMPTGQMTPPPAWPTSDPHNPQAPMARPLSQPVPVSQYHSPAASMEPPQNPQATTNYWNNPPDPSVQQRDTSSVLHDVSKLYDH